MNRRLPQDRVTIRRATVADAQAIGACHNTCWRQAYRGLVSEEWLAALDDAARSEMWHQALSEGPGPTLVVAEIGDRVVGFTAAGTSNDDPPLRDLELYALYVLEAEYGTGIGQKAFRRSGERPNVFVVGGRAQRAGNRLLPQAGIPAGRHT